MMGRIQSVDALRGFAMIWIIGADSLVHLLAATCDWTFLQHASAQLRHAEWEGLHAYDLVFPIFMFVSGASLALSWQKRRNDGTEGGAFLRKTAIRAALLVLLGIIYNFGWDWSADRFRVASVLGQIGVAYLIAAAVCVRSKTVRTPASATVIIFVMVAWLQLKFPVPGIGAGQMTPEGIVNGWLDRAILPGRLHGGTYDPEGILSVLSSSSLMLLGLICGRVILRLRHVGRLNVVVVLLVAGPLLVAAGYALSPGYPMIKSAWTVPYILAAAGYSMLLLAIFYGLTDVANFRPMHIVFAPIGMNAIGIYMAARFLAYPAFARLGPGANFESPMISIALVTSIIVLEWLLLWGCYRRRWFLSL